MKHRKKYTGDLHDQPYDLEENVSSRAKKDPDYDRRDLADKAHEYRTTEIPVKEQRSHGKAMREGAERQAYNDTNDDSGVPGGASVTGRLGVRNPNAAAHKTATGSMIADAGGYAAQTDPASNYAERYYGYCLNCGEPINHAGPRVCEVELAGGDRCVLEAPKGYLTTGCQSCREWWDLDRGYHRSGKGRQAKTCKPTAEERAAWTRKGTVKSRCAREWAAKLKQAGRKGIDRDTAERTLAAQPKLRDHDRIRIELDQLDAEIRAGRQQKRRLMSKGGRLIGAIGTSTTSS